MKKNYFLLFFLSLSCAYSYAQIFDVATIQYKGDPNKFINLVIMGDGYTATQQDDFIITAGNLSSYLFSQSPWSEYKDYFNVYAIKVISTQSGAKHANTASDCNSVFPLVPISNPTNYFGTHFDAYGIHRLTVPSNNIAIANVLANNFPNYDQVFIVANSPYYGGSGGAYATFTANSDSNEVAAHEIGHSFAGLADEYYAGDQYFLEKPNMTQQSIPSLNKWTNWITPDDDIDIYSYCCGGNSAIWFKPASHSCKMEELNRPYCSVCKQGIVEKIHTLVNPIVSYTPSNATTIATTEPLIDFQLTELMKPIPNTLHVKWQLDATLSDTNSENFQVNQTILTEGIHTLTASVTDETTLVRVNNHATLHINTISWQINKSSLGIYMQTQENKIECRIYPNPSQDAIHIAFDLDKNSTVAIDVISPEGKIIHHIPSQIMNSGKQENTIPVEGIHTKTYFVVVTIDGVKYTTTMMKN